MSDTREPHYRLNTPTVALQIIDGEAILIHFERGSYFSARRTGCEILARLETGTALPALIDGLVGLTGASRAIVAEAAMRYVALLLAEDLIAEVDPADVVGGVPEPRRAESAPFVEPELEKYTDLEDLLLLDPIHDVGDAGWPPPATSADAET